MNQENQIAKNVPWNKGKLIGQKSPLKLKEIWAIPIRLQMAKNTRELVFNCISSIFYRLYLALCQKKPQKSY